MLDYIEQGLESKEKEFFSVSNLNSKNIEFILKKTERKPLDLDPYGNLFDNNISYFNECMDLLKNFIIKVPHLYKKDNYVLDLQNYIDELINSETTTLRKKVAVIETRDIENILKLNFSKDQNYVYDILINNFFSNNDVIEYNLDNTNIDDNENQTNEEGDKTINIYIYKSRHYIVNVLIIFLIFIFKKNKLDICEKNHYYIILE